MRCDVLVFWDATIFCNNFARWLQKVVATSDAMCWFFWDATIFCNNFARWLQKIVATCDAMCWFSGKQHADPEIPDLKMLIRAGNAVWRSKRRIGIRGFQGLATCDADLWSTFKGREYLLCSANHLKSASKIRISSFVPPSKIFVWEGYSHYSNCRFLTVLLPHCWFNGMLWSFVTTLQDDYKR